jgi:thioesterase domain-containing protein
VHGAGGVVIRFYELARYLGPEQPVYGLQARGLDGRHPCDVRVEDMAEHYLEEIRRVQPKGPYLLGGYSLGGMVAFEMAQRLIAEGNEKVSVVLFDTFCTPPENGSNGSRNGTESLGQNLLAAWQKLAQSSAGEKWQAAKRVAVTVKDGVHRRVSDLTLPRSLKKVHRACEMAVKSYVPRAYPGRLLLFRSRYKPLTQLRDPHAAWSRYAAQGLEIREVEGNHENILLEPQVRSVAQELKNYLKAAAE